MSNSGSARTQTHPEYMACALQSARCRLNQSPNQTTVFQRGPQGERSRQAVSCLRSKKWLTRPRFVGLRSHAQEIIGAIAGLQSWEILALPRKGSAGVGRVSKRKVSCRLTCGLHSKVT